MFLNEELLRNARDLQGDINLRDCPAPIKDCADKLLTLAISLAPLDSYETPSELDKKLCVLYWRFFDGLDQGTVVDFDRWFVEKATYPEHIRRARQWLVSAGYLRLRPGVASLGVEAGRCWRGTFHR